MGFFQNRINAVKAWWSNQQQQGNRYRNTLPQMNRQQARQAISNKKFVTPDNVSNMYPVGMTSSVSRSAIKELARREADKRGALVFQDSINAYKKQLYDEAMEYQKNKALRIRKTNFFNSIPSWATPEKMVDNYIKRFK